MIGSETTVRIKHLLAAFAIQAAVVGVAAQAPSFAQAAAPARLNPNTATAQQISALPHMTPALAATIQSKKPFANTAAFDAAIGASLDAKQKSELYAQLFVPISLNRATAAEINLIPGMTRRMVHEFEEYRPYTSLAQFDKEIGKYVSKDEVARLRSYVALD